MRQKISTKLMNSMAELLRLSPNYFSFLGGIVIGASINIYTGIFVTDTRPTKWIFLLIASILLFVSGLYWTRIALRLEKLHNAPEWVQNVSDASAGMHTGADIRLGQRIDDVPASTITSVSFKLKKSGNPPGTFFVRARNVSGDAIIGGRHFPIKT